MVRAQVKAPSPPKNVKGKICHHHLPGATNSLHSRGKWLLNQVTSLMDWWWPRTLYSFIPATIFTEHLLHARTVPGTNDNVVNKKDVNPCLHRAYILVEDKQ